MSKNEITSINQTFLKNASEVLEKAKKKRKDRSQPVHGLCLL